MLNKTLIRAVGGFFLLDGILLLAFGRTYVRPWQWGPGTSLYRRAMDWLAERPNWPLRVAGAAEAGLGLAVLRRSPVGVQSLYHIAAGVYDAIAPVWVDRGHGEAYLALDQALSASLPTGGHVLDLGCGTGANLERLRRLGLPFGSYTGVDQSDDILARARMKFGQVANARFHRLDLMTDSLPGGPFDLIVSTWVFEHLPEPGRAVEKAWQGMRPGGYMVLLFEIETDAWRDRLIQPVWHFFSAHLLREEEYRSLPGLVSIECFAGVGPTVALVVSRKPEGPAPGGTSQAKTEEMRDRTSISAVDRPT